MMIVKQQLGLGTTAGSHWHSPANTAGVGDVRLLSMQAYPAVNRFDLRSTICGERMT